jgi:hypothetical protein
MIAWVILDAEQPEAIDVTLARPIHAVSITSEPDGAAIYIEGRLAGTTPANLNVLGFVPLSVTIAKPGFAPVLQNLYSSAPRDSLAVRLRRDVR